MKVYTKRAIIGECGGEETLHTLAHDLRTPMCCVAGAAQLALLAAKEGKNVDVQLRQILQAVGAMDELLRTACGVQETRMLSVDTLERELCAVIAPRAQEKRQKLCIDLRGLRSVRMEIDAAALTRVLLNLLGNAVKYTQEGGEIILRGGVRPGLRPGQAQRAVFAVRDNGMGIKPEFAQRLFEPGERAQETAHLPGKGLGLSIVRRLVQEMDGVISAQSEWGKGSTFTVSIPVKGG
ncbi:MAG: HAMP domain-containing histidine kinase [Clostridia bacterium]|nr:HAMP domain-containing histidine kinase [Clostridia bacterium]